MQKNRWWKWVWIGAVLVLAGILALPLKRYDCVLKGLPFVATSDGFNEVSVKGENLYLVDFPRPGATQKIAAVASESDGREIWQTNSGGLFSMKFFVWGVLLSSNDPSVKHAIGWRKWGF